MNVIIYSAGMPFNGETVKTRSLGGSESAAYYLAKELAARGHKVACFTSLQDPSDSHSDGVDYFWHGAMTQEAPLGERFEHYARNTPHDALVLQRLPFAFHRPFASKVCVWQLHDLALYRSSAQMLGGSWQMDAVTCVSQWHADQVKQVWNVNPNILRVVRNGVDPWLYDDDYPHKVMPVVRAHAITKISVEKIGGTSVLQLPADKFIMLYQSRPERGLEHLVRPGGIMDRLRDSNPNVQLVICGYDNTMENMRTYYEKLHAWGKALPNVSYVGALTKPELAVLQKKCDILCYPTEFDEVSCITAMEAMNAHLPMLTSACAALPETCADSGTILIPLKDGRADEDAFVNEIIRLSETDGVLGPLIEAQREAAEDTHWSQAAASLESVIMECFDDKSDGAVLRHAIEHSDIGFARWFSDTLPTDGQDAIVKSSIDELNRMYAFTESAEAYAAHYAKHQTAYYDEFEERVIGEDVTGTTRFQGTFGAIAEHIRKTSADHIRVLDYGCAHGHYTIPIAKTLTHADFFGMDISERAVNAARKWAAKENLPNVEFHQGDESALTEDIGEFDVIIAGEVLEHVRDYRALMDKLRNRLVPGGCIIFTTPTGRWEYTGTVAFRTGREHLHQFERADIEDICAGHEVRIQHAPASHDQAARPLGSYVWTVWPNQTLMFGEIDYERKLRFYKPRQTVSACLIVKDGERTLRKCVESFIDYVDEVVICVDPATKDRTLSIANELVGDFPNRPILVKTATKSAMKDGFDEARNESIEGASGDWILWCDADEEVQHADKLHALLRRSLHNGYGFPQVHYSVDPQQVLTTDFPCRVFRNHLGAKFYGVVHEHPEVEMGKAIDWSIIRHDIKFLHSGYVDENTRRKRFERNYPLLIRDREKYPTRYLNKFLLIRDIAQSMMFEQQQSGGQILPWHPERAKEGIALMEELVSMEGKQFSPRMIADAMQYYSHCVLSAGGGFDAEVTIKTKNDIAPDLAVSLDVRGRFHSRDFYKTLLTRLTEESTKLYEERYI